MSNPWEEYGWIILRSNMNEKSVGAWRFRRLLLWSERGCASYIVTNSAILAATLSIDSSSVLNPLREPSNGLTSRKSSKVVL